MPRAVKLRNRREDAEARAVLGDRDGYTEVTRQGARRPRVRANSFEAFLTERQRTVLKGKVRQGKAWGRILQTMEETGMTIEEFVATLSPEELARGQVKDKNGNFSGQPPQWVPRAFHRACISELMKRGAELWRANYIDAIKAMTDIARNASGQATPGEVIKAAQFVIERLEGKMPERLIVAEEQPWMAALDGIVADVPDESIARARKKLEAGTLQRLPAGAEEEDVLEAEVVGDEEDWETPAAPVRSRRASRVRR